jgi:hypothetical protein
MLGAVTVKVVASVLTLALLTAVRSAHADPVADDADVTARLAWIEHVLERDESSIRTWRGAFLGIYSAAALAEGALLANATTSADRINAAINAGKAGIGFTFLLVSPFTGNTAGTLLHALPAGTPAERRAKLARAEAWLRTSAKEEQDARGWFPQIGGAVLNVGGAWLSWATTRGTSGNGWFGLVSGVVGAELQILTAPSGATRAWAQYTRGGAGRLGRVPAANLGLSIAPGVGGATLRGWF